MTHNYSNYRVHMQQCTCMVCKGYSISSYNMHAFTRTCINTYTMYIVYNT